MDSVVRSRPGFGFSWCVALSLLFVSAASGETRSVAEEGVRERLPGVRVPFVANTGQTDPRVAYYAQTFAGTVFVTRCGRIVYSLPGKSAGHEKDSRGRPRAAASPGWSLTESPVGATGERRRARPVAQKRAQTQVSYFLGNDPSAWRSGIATYEGVSLGQVWPGVSLSLRANGKNVEKLFTIEPGADPSRIRMRVSGARSLRTDEAGGLIASTGPGDVRLTRPAAYQEQGGARRAVAVAYEARGDIYGFRLGSYDPALPVLIDPLLRSTYLGGSVTDIAQALAIHPSGDVYVAGYTSSTNFPGTTGGWQPAHAVDGSNTDAFVAQLTSDLTMLIKATYLGGSGADIAYALAIHPSGDVYVAGQTNSLDFPVTLTAAQNIYHGGAPFNLGDAFVARLNPSLTTLNQATYLGGTNDDVAYALAIHLNGDVYVAGYTRSTNFPFTTGGAQPTNVGGFIAFVARLDATLTNAPTLPQATYLGADDVAYALAIHPILHDVYVAGYTLSPNFPFTTGGVQSACNSCTPGTGSDAFVARLSPTLTTVIQATYLGGTRSDTARALAINSLGHVYVAGETNSAFPGAVDFPFTAGGAQPANSGLGTFYDAFVARLDATLTPSPLTQATYLGGSGHDHGYALAIDPASDDVYVAGDTDFTTFPFTANGAQSASGGGTDAFVARLDAALTLATPPQATYLGGSGADFGYALAIHPACGDVYVAGYTGSTNFPTTSGGAQAATGGDLDAFVARFTSNLQSTPQVCPPCVPAPSGMVAWWPLDETGGTVVHDVADGNNGTPETLPVGAGGPTPGTGMVAGALRFNGTSDFVQVPNAPNLNFGTGSLSIDAWIRIPPPGTGFMPIVDKEVLGPTDAPYGYVFYVRDGHLGFSLSNDINDSAHAFIGADDLTTNLADNLWHHVAVTVERSPSSAVGGNLFIAGMAIPTSVFSTLPPTLTADNTGDLILGSRNRLGRLPVADFFKGSIDEVEIFDRALQPGEIKSIADARGSGKCKCLLVSGDRIACNPDGTLSYTFTVTNLTSAILPAGSVTFVPQTSGVTISPMSLASPLLPGVPTTVSVTISVSSPFVGPSFCFTVLLAGAGAVTRCTEHCITLPDCCIQPPAGMAAWWPLDEGSGATSVADIASGLLTGVGHDGTPQAGPVGMGGPISGAPNSSPAVVGGSLYFPDGSRYVQVPDAPPLALDIGTGDFTIDAWVVANGGPAAIVDKFDATTQTGYRLYLDATTLYFSYGDGITRTVPSILPIPFHLWHHVAVTVHRSAPPATPYYLQVLFYVDGTPEGGQSVIVPVGSIANTLDLFIGGFHPPTSGATEIGIDELELFHRALSQTEIQDIFNAGSAGKCKFLHRPRDVPLRVPRPPVRRIPPR